MHFNEITTITKICRQFRSKTNHVQTYLENITHSAHTSTQPQACYIRYSNSNAHCLALILANMNQFLSLVPILFVSHDALIIRVNKLSN